MRSAAFFGLFLNAANALQGPFHEETTVPYGWKRLPEPPRGNLTLQVAFKFRNLHNLEARLLETSTPKNAESYGKHLTRDEVNALVKPDPSSRLVVAQWLEEAGAVVHHTSEDGMTFATGVEHANRILNADFAYYEDTNGVRKLRTTHYAIPGKVSEHLDLIHPTTYFGQMKAHAPAPRNQIYLEPVLDVTEAANASCADLITPDCLRDLYNVRYAPDPLSGSQIAFSNFLNESSRYEDLDLFERAFNIPTQNVSKVILVNGGVDNQTMDSKDRTEANLDLQTIVGLAHPLPVTSYITAGSPPFVPNLDIPVLNTNEPYLEFYAYLLAQPDGTLPQVLSSSYGDDEQTVPVRYARRVCNQIMQLTARGVTVIVSSGDTGVGAACRANDGSNATQFTPQFPASCPYVTAVGGTQGYEPEAAWIGSSGGFSNYFERPQYQETVVQQYLDQSISAEAKAYYQPFVNFRGRAFPDVAAHSDSPR